MIFQEIYCRESDATFIFSKKLWKTYTDASICVCFVSIEKSNTIQ